MLRITLMSLSLESVILKLDGKLVGTCVSTLREECLSYKNKDNRTVILDFSGVSFIDPEGVKMLESIKDERLHFVNCPMFIKKLLEHLI